MEMKWQHEQTHNLDKNGATGLTDFEIFSAVFHFSSSVNQETGIISLYTWGSEAERDLFKVIQEVYSRTGN